MEKQPCTREKAISSMLSFYQLLTQLPYIPPDKLMLPPPTGWPISQEGAEEEGSGIKATELRNRGVRDVLIVCCDGLTGLPDAITATWPKAIVQSCVVHLIRNAMRFASWKDRKSIAAMLRPSGE